MISYFYTSSFCLILGTTLIEKKKIKSTFHRSVPFASWYVVIQVVGYFWFQVLFLCKYYFFFDKVMGRLGTAYIYSFVFISSSDKHLP